MRNLVSRLLLSFSLVAFTTAFARPVFAQPQEMDELAARLAPTISKSRQDRILVIDFTDLDGNRNELGKILADELSAALAKLATGFQVIDRSHWNESFDEKSLPSWPMLSEDLAKSIAVKTGAKSIIWGELLPLEHSLKIEARCTRIPKIKLIVKFISEIPASPGRRPLFEKLSQTTPLVPNAGSFGYGEPRCEKCSSPPYAEEAARRGVEGVILLRVTVTPDGDAKRISVIKSLGFGLDEKAIEAVSKWKFKPALGPDEKPAAVKTIVEVTFRLGRRF